MDDDLLFRKPKTKSKTNGTLEYFKVCMRQQLLLHCVCYCIGNVDDEYSVLQASNVRGYDPSDRDYSHLETKRNGAAVHCTPDPVLSTKQKQAKDKRGKDLNVKCND